MQRNECPRGNESLCGYPSIYGRAPAAQPATGWREVALNASAAIGPDGVRPPGAGPRPSTIYLSRRLTAARRPRLQASIVLTARGAPPGFEALGSAYGHGAWPMTLFFAAGGSHLPVLPWRADVAATRPWAAALLQTAPLKASDGDAARASPGAFPTFWMADTSGLSGVQRDHGPERVGPRRDELGGCRLLRRKPLGLP